VLECILAAVDSSVLRAHSKQVVVDGDVNFNAVRTILPLIVPFLLQQHTTPPSLSLLALRIFVALSHTHPGSIECLTALSSENHTTGSDAANQEETMGGQEQQVQQQPGGRKTVLYALLEWKVGELERMGSPSVPMSDTPSASAVQNPSAFLPHLDFLGHLAELLMCLITCGSVSAHPTASFTALHTGTLRRGLSIPAQLRPGQDDVWLAMTVSQLLPGLAAVAAVCGCPVRSQLHPPGDPSLVHYLHQNGLLPSLIAPDHPLPRLTTWFDQQLAQANALPPSVCLQLTSLRSMFSALLVRLVCCGHLPIANLATGPSALQVPQREWTLDQRVERVRKSGGGTGEASSASEEEWRNNMREAIESDDASTSQLHANHESRITNV
jgi:hypothetical protein